jgi:hypothetical protein
MRTAAATGPEARLIKPAINPRQIINCALSILSIVRLRPNFLEKWDKGPSVAADCTISFYFWFTRSVGDLPIIQHVVDTAIEGSSCVTTLNLIQVKFVYPSYHEWSASAPGGDHRDDCDVRFVHIIGTLNNREYRHGAAAPAVCGGPVFQARTASDRLGAKGSLHSD